MSLLGMVGHMAEVERDWFRRRFAGHDVLKRYQTEADPDADADADFNGGDRLRRSVTRDHDLDFVGCDSESEPVSLREPLAHMIEEYARHNTHADLLRERIDGRVGR